MSWKIFSIKNDKLSKSKEINKATITTELNYKSNKLAIIFFWTKFIQNVAQNLFTKWWSKSFRMHAFQGIPWIPNYRNVKVVDDFRKRNFITFFRCFFFCESEKRRSESSFNILLVQLHVLPKLRIFYSFIHPSSVRLEERINASTRTLNMTFMHTVQLQKFEPRSPCQMQLNDIPPCKSV